MRESTDGLMATVQEKLSKDAYSGHLSVFQSGHREAKSALAGVRAKFAVSTPEGETDARYSADRLHPPLRLARSASASARRKMGKAGLSPPFPTFAAAISLVRPPWPASGYSPSAHSPNPAFAPRAPRSRRSGPRASARDRLAARTGPVWRSGQQDRSRTCCA